MDKLWRKKSVKGLQAEARADFGLKKALGTVDLTAIGILGSLVICTVLYILVALVVTGVVNYSRLNVADPVAVAIDAIGIHWLAVLVKLGAIAGLTSVILVLLLGQPRIIFSMAHDGLLPPFFAKIHPRFGYSCQHDDDQRLRGCNDRCSG